MLWVWGQLFGPSFEVTTVPGGKLSETRNFGTLENTHYCAALSSWLKTQQENGCHSGHCFHQETLTIQDKKQSLLAWLGIPEAEALEKAVLQLFLTLLETNKYTCLQFCYKYTLRGSLQIMLSAGPTASSGLAAMGPILVMQHTFLEIGLQWKHHYICEKKTQHVSKDVPTTPQRHIPEKEEQCSKPKTTCTHMLDIPDFVFTSCLTSHTS